MASDADIAREALRLLKDGKAWCRDELQNEHGRRCLVGALGKASGLNVRRIELEGLGADKTAAWTAWDALPPSLRNQVERIIAEQWPDWEPEDTECIVAPDPVPVVFNDDADHKFRDIRLILEKIASD